MEKKIMQIVSAAAKVGLNGMPTKGEEKAMKQQEDFSKNTGLVFDYNEKQTENKYIVVEGESLCCAGAEVYQATFRNFPALRINDLQLEECTFENCKRIHFTDCEVRDCCFTGVDILYADSAPLAGCTFQQLRCENDCLLSLEDSEISFCTFQDIELTNESYLVDGVGNSWIESCHFENIRTDREDKAIIFCEELVGKFIKRKKQFCIVDESSCTGLDQIQCAADREPPVEDERTKAIQRAVARGFLPASAVDALKDEPRDISQWDPAVLEKSFADEINSIPVYNCLTRAGLKTIGDLVKLNEIQIMKIRYIGQVTIDRVKELLQQKGIQGSAWDTFEKQKH